MTKWYTCLFGHSWSRWYKKDYDLKYPLTDAIVRDRETYTVTFQERMCERCGVFETRMI